MMEKAKELTGLLEARMEHLIKLKIEDAKSSYKGLTEERFKGELENIEFLRISYYLFFSQLIYQPFRGNENHY